MLYMRLHVNLTTFYLPNQKIFEKFTMTNLNVLF